MVKDDRILAVKDCKSNAHNLSTAVDNVGDN